jgi:hypothetical protein
LDLGGAELEDDFWLFDRELRMFSRSKSAKIPRMCDEAWDFKSVQRVKPGHIANSRTLEDIIWRCRAASQHKGGIVSEPFPKAAGMNVS